MIQDEISTDNGLTFTTYGEAYPRFKADKEDQYNYSNTAEKTIPQKMVQKLNKHTLSTISRVLLSRKNILCLKNS